MITTGKIDLAIFLCLCLALIVENAQECNRRLERGLTNE